MDSPRKKVKTSPLIDAIPQSPASSAHIQVPASSPINENGASASHNGFSSPSMNGNGKRAGSAVAPSSDDEVKPYDIARTEFQSAPNATGRMPASMRKAGFPSQQKMLDKLQASAPIPTRPPSQASNSSAAHSPAAYTNSASPGVQQMRQHAQMYQYSPVTTSVQMRPPQYAYPGPANPYSQQGHPPPQSAQQFYDGKPHQVAPQQYSQQQPAGQIRRDSMADQYSAGRSRPRLVQHNSAASQYQAQPGNYPPMSNNHNQQYAPQMSYQQPYLSQHPYMNQQQQQRPQAQQVSPAAIAKLSEVFPHLPDAILKKAIIQARGNVDDAQALIADDRVTIDLTESNAPQSQAIYAMPHGYSQNTIGGGMPHQTQRQLPASTKREVKAPNLSIREKQALRTAQTYPGQYPYQNPYAMQHPQHPNLHQQQHHHQQQQDLYRLQQQQQMYQQQQYRQQQFQKRPNVPVPVYEAPKLRTRVAKKGPKIDIGSDESEDDAAVEIDSEGHDESEVDSDDDQDVDAEVGVYLDFDRVALESRVLHYLNTVATAKELADLAACTEDIASFIIASRPFPDLVTVSNLDQLPPGKRPSRTRKTVGTKVVEISIDSMEGYEAIDSLVARCEDYGKTVKEAMNQWGIDVDKVDDKDGALDVVTIDADKAASKASDILYLKDQPTLLPEGMLLKDYQLFGVNWLHLMYQKKLSGILADEMGLGKTCQVISFLGVLLERGLPGPHLIVVPASTLENWLREISRFCPSLKVEAYYGSQRERNEFREEFEGDNKRDFNIMVTTYQLATGAKDDRSFLKRQPFDVCVYDEGHNLKNSASSRYKYLMALKANFRLLLTGTPLQNNLKELISLLAFVLPKVFAGNMDRLDSIFKIKAFGDSESLTSALLSQQRIKRAKTMMTPFILRRYKKDVLDDLPPKKYRIDYVELNEAQKEIYNEHLGTTRKALEEKADGAEVQAKDIKSAVNVMMQLRKCSNHPMLFRRQYDDKLLKKMAKNILKEEVFQDSEENLVIEDMEVMTDFELNRLCLRYPRINQFALEQDCWMDACKVQHLQKLIPEMKKNGDRILLFSQFTQTLDILENCMDTMGISYFRLDGSTDVSARQDLIDQFYAEPDITVFLLSTKAGGFGINLACANVVIIYDSSFNPHDDKQAEDRAHRVGQKKEVQIVRIVAKDTIEEHIVRLANTKLTLDSSVSGDADLDNKAIEEQGEKKVAQTLISQLKAQS